MPRYRAPEGTLPLLTGILHMMDYTHRDMCAIVRDLPAEALAWKPGDAMGSLSGIVRHTMYCEIYALRRAAGEDVTTMTQRIGASGRRRTTRRHSSPPSRREMR